MGQIIESVCRFLESDHWGYERRAGRQVLTIPFAGKSGKWTCYAQERFTQFLFYSVVPINAPEAVRAQVAEYLTRANYGLVMGNFELDFKDGEIRYKTMVDVGDGELTENLIRPVVYVNCMMMDKYFPGLMSVMFGNVSPADAVALIENSPTASA
ncbi:MAG: YbjN domain-containing protein [Candidatus Schekmanbacteria bacterium]|nr:YbjN domain-containing protein [Candidatus Schekmanbacteria bacterium]